MNWKGQQLNTVGDLLYKGIIKCETPKEAQEFMQQYRAENEHADSNVGYLSGYCSIEEAKRIKEWFGVKHPIFD